MLALFGATGYSGRLIAGALARQGCTELLIAGRRIDRLESLQHELEKAAKTKLHIAVADVHAPDSLGELAERSSAIINCVGPFMDLGRPVQEACLSHRAHYLDLTGEAPFIRQSLELQERAHEAKVALVNAVGFDVVPTDFIAALAAKELGEDLDQVELGLSVRGMAPSGGTQRSLLSLISTPGMRVADGEIVEEGLAKVHRSFDFPEHGVRECVSVPIADITCLERSTGARRARTYVAVPKTLSYLTGAAGPLFTYLGKKAAVEAIQKRLLPEGEGPGLERRRHSTFAAVAEATGNSGKQMRATITGADIYGLTAELAAFAGRQLVDKDFDKSGVLTPTQAIDIAHWRRELESLACRISVESDEALF